MSKDELSNWIAYIGLVILFCMVVLLWIDIIMPIIILLYKPLHWFISNYSVYGVIIGGILVLIAVKMKVKQNESGGNKNEHITK